MTVCSSEKFRLLGMLENLKGKKGRQEVAQVTYGITAFQHLEDSGGVQQHVKHGILTLKPMMLLESVKLYLELVWLQQLK